MFVILADLFKPHVLIGSLVMYSLLFILCIFVYWRRSSKNANRTLHFTLATSIFGVLSSALQLGAPYIVSYADSEKTLITGLCFAMALVPLIWMVGISLFSVLLKGQKKRPLQVLLGYLLTLIQFVLIIVCTVYIDKTMNGDSYNLNIVDLHIYSDLFISITCINWGFFLLLIWLIIQYRRFIPRSIIITVIIFGVLNTARLITETALLRSGGDLPIQVLFYVMFFFTDFISCVSLYMTTIWWKNVQKATNDEQLIV